MARSTRSAATERAYHQFAPSSHGFPWCAAPAGPEAADEFDESDIWGAFNPAAIEPAELPLVRPVPTTRPGRKTKPVGRSGGAAAHGSLPVNIPDWSKILGDEYRRHHASDWELDVDVDDEDIEAGALVPPHELAWRRRAASLSVHEGVGIGRTLKVRDAVWKKTGFQD